MKYMALIYSSPDAEPKYGTPEFQKMLDGNFAFTAHLHENGTYISGDGLLGAETAISLRINAGKVETMDGPFGHHQGTFGRLLCYGAVRSYHCAEICGDEPDRAVWYGRSAPAVTPGQAGRGATVPLLDQDRVLWDGPIIADGLIVLDSALARNIVGPFKIKAAITACHVHDAGPVRPQVSTVYCNLNRPR